MKMAQRNVNHLLFRPSRNTQASLFTFTLNAFLLPCSYDAFSISIILRNYVILGPALKDQANCSDKSNDPEENKKSGIIQGATFHLKSLRYKYEQAVARNSCGRV